jgi:CheY-like chemotaxis protein
MPQLPVSVLLVSAFADESEMYAEYLRYEGFDVYRCADPTTAMTMLQQRPVDIVIARLRRVGAVGGLAFTRRVKADHETAHVPVIVLTTHMQPSVRADAEAAGCDAFFLLPCSPDLIACEVRRLTGSTDG